MLRPLRFCLPRIVLALILGILSRPALAENFAVLKWIDGSCTIAGTSSSTIDMDGVTVLGLYKVRSIGENALVKAIKDKKCRTLRTL